MQLVGPVQLTALNSSSVCPAMSGVLTTAHEAPFHCSAKVSVPLVVELGAHPVAMHHAGPVHDTLAKNASAYGLGNVGVGLADQVEPFHT